MPVQDPDVNAGPVEIHYQNDYAMFMPGYVGATKWQNFGEGRGEEVYPEWNPEDPSHHVMSSPDSYLPTVLEIDEEIGGATGQLNKSMYTLGVVSSNNVENFELTGRQIRIRRQPDGNYGPVSGGMDHSANYLPQYAQGTNISVPDEWLYADLGSAI